jgi:hypothetical protein
VIAKNEFSDRQKLDPDNVTVIAAW